MKVDGERRAGNRADKPPAASKTGATLEDPDMCGIVGYIGPRDATPIILNGLKRLEYRGYDSAGIAVNTGAGSRARALGGLECWML